MELKIKILIFLILMTAALILLLLMITLGFGIKDESSNNSYKNGIVTNIWLQDNSKLDIIRKNRIRYLFVDVGDINKTGKTGNEEEIMEFLRFIKDYESKNSYYFALIAYTEINTYNYDLNEEFIQNYIEDSKKLVSLGFDGILVDIEPVRFGLREKYLALLRELKERLPENSLLSAYAGTISNDKNNEWEWEHDFYRKVSDRVDIVSMQGYDTDIKNKEDYKNFIKSQVKEICKRQWNSLFLLGVPTHKQEPETIENALEAFGEEIKKCPSNKFLGVNIFAEWTTDKNEWKIFKKYF